MEIEKTEDERIMIKKGVMPVFLSMEEEEELNRRIDSLVDLKVEWKILSYILDM